MSKKQQALTPHAYLKSGMALKLPVYKCYVPESWRETKKFYLVFSRQHVNGNITLAGILVDLLCTGIKDVIYRVNMPMFEFERFLEDLEEGIEDEMIEVSRDLAHNIVYGALEYGSDNGIRPHEDFRWAALIIGPDSDDVPLIDDIPFGELGMPLLLLDGDDPKEAYYLRQLRTHVGEGNFRAMHRDDYFEEDDDDEYTDGEVNMHSEIHAIANWNREDWEQWFENVVDLDMKDLNQAVQFQSVLFFIYTRFIFRNALTEFEMDALIGQPIEWTDEQIETGYGVNLPEEVNDEMVELTQVLKDGSTERQARDIRDRLTQLIEEYPHIPYFYNLRYNAIRVLDGIEAFREEVAVTLERFPDYFFAKLDLIDAMLEAGEEFDFADFFGGATNLSAIFPTRKLFHASEVIKFSTLMIRYHLRLKQHVQAYAYYSDVVGLADLLPPPVLRDLMEACSFEAVRVLTLADQDPLFREDLFDTLLEVEDDENY
ncbi:hypothetical protein ADIS_4781 [Lunatimonas lonarensis]|uniref:Uncharacterized protein n=1 Tax=Lunatimonas lonarensis TaxID=1232681 RepID=R7ZL10_9BACT|nr:hypothetical protein [Lunatimonas lonarensis]EON74762.1 hypothetical protein ADIS_4781 [Lunatimonas lonarensis]